MVVVNAEGAGFNHLVLHEFPAGGVVVRVKVLELAEKGGHDGQLAYASRLVTGGGVAFGVAGFPSRRHIVDGHRVARMHIWENLTDLLL